MSICSSCQKEVPFLQVYEGGLCEDCYADSLSKEKRKMFHRVFRFARKWSGIESPELVGVGFWNVVNRQTVAKDIGQAFLSGALGMAAPFLVKGSDYAGNIGLIVLEKGEMVFVDFGLAPLEGSDKTALKINEHHLTALNRGETEYPTRRVSFSDIDAEYETSTLTLGGELDISLSLPTLGILADTATAQAIAYKINGMSEFVSPDDFLAGLLKGEAPPSSQELEAMVENPAYFGELTTKFEAESRKNRSVLLTSMDRLPSFFRSKMRDFVLQRSEGWEKPPITSLITIPLGILGIALAVIRFVWLFQHDDELVRGSLEASGLREIGVFVLSIILLVVGINSFVKLRTRQWYNQQLESVLK